MKSNLAINNGQRGRVAAKRLWGMLGREGSVADEEEMESGQGDKWEKWQTEEK